MSGVNKMEENYSLKLQLNTGEIYSQFTGTSLPDPHRHPGKSHYLYIYKVKVANPSRTVTFGSNGSGISNVHVYSTLKTGKTSFTVLAKDREERSYIVNTVLNRITAIYVTTKNELSMWRAEAHPVSVSFEENRNVNGVEINVQLENTGYWTSNLYCTTDQDLQVSPNTMYSWKIYGDEYRKQELFRATALDKANQNQNILTFNTRTQNYLPPNVNGILFMSPSHAMINWAGQNALYLKDACKFVLTDRGSCFTVDVLNNITGTPVNNILLNQVDISDYATPYKHIGDLLQGIENGDTHNLQLAQGSTACFVKLSEATMI